MTYTKEYKPDQRHLLGNDILRLCLLGTQFAVAPVPMHRDGKFEATGVLQLTVFAATDPFAPATA